MTIVVLITERDGTNDHILEDFIVHPINDHQTDDELAASIKEIVQNRWDTDE